MAIRELVVRLCESFSYRPPDLDREVDYFAEKLSGFELMVVEAAVAGWIHERSEMPRPWEIRNLAKQIMAAREQAERAERVVKQERKRERVHGRPAPGLLWERARTRVLRRRFGGRPRPWVFSDREVFADVLRAYRASTTQAPPLEVLLAIPLEQVKREGLRLGPGALRALLRMRDEFPESLADLAGEEVPEGLVEEASDELQASDRSSR